MEVPLDTLRSTRAVFSIIDSLMSQWLDHGELDVDQVAWLQRHLGEHEIYGIVRKAEEEQEEADKRARKPRPAAKAGATVLNPGAEQILDRVREAGAAAEHMLIWGLGSDHCDLTEQVAALAKCPDPEIVEDGDGLERYAHIIETAYVVGIAVGIRLTPKVLEGATGGGR